MAVEELVMPSYNHTRGDSPLTPCPLCAEKKNVFDLLVALDTAEAALRALGKPNEADTVVFIRRAMTKQVENKLDEYFLNGKF